MRYNLSDSTSVYKFVSIGAEMSNPREMYPFYIGVNKTEEKEMLQELGLNELSELFAHLPQEARMESLALPAPKERDELEKHIQSLAAKNNMKVNFIGDGLQDFSVAPIVPLVSGIRGLTTAYTPYQPERSQETLQTLWIYQSVIAEITGFEAVNASLYDRSTCLHEALACALRMSKGKSAVVVAENIYPGDRAVLD